MCRDQPIQVVYFFGKTKIARLSPTVSNPTSINAGIEDLIKLSTISEPSRRDYQAVFAQRDTASQDPIEDWLSRLGPEERFKFEVGVILTQERRLCPSPPQHFPHTLTNLEQGIIDEINLQSYSLDPNTTVFGPTT